ncbi:hypothetical protein PINS_up013905 [Pythium insidiosum]|nr:hypothetical protein PINS_up013905 [Pythium insidiosum]
MADSTDDDVSADVQEELEVDDAAIVALRDAARERFEGEGDLVGAAALYTRVLSRQPKCPRSNFNLAVILQTMGEAFFAIDHMLRVVAHDDNDAVAHTVLRTVLHTEEPELVLAGYDALLAQHPTHVRAKHSVATLRGDATVAAPAYVRQVFDDLAETFEEKLVTHLEYRVPWQLVDALQQCKRARQGRRCCLRGRRSRLWHRTLRPSIAPLRDAHHGNRFVATHDRKDTRHGVLRHAAL